MPSCPDACLLAAARRGEDRAYSLLFDRHRPTALRYARSFRIGSADADEAVCAAFARVFAVVQDGRGPELDLLPYLLVAVRNAVMQQLRQRKGRILYLPGIAENAAVSDPRAAEADDGPVSDRTRAAFDSLPAAWRRVLWATQVDGVGTHQLAERLSLSPNATAALAMRARRGLRRAFAASDTCGA
jgi:RNA polymerase sigma factor (sigma-70 family)